VEELQPNTWIKAFFNDFLKCDMLLNNHSEVFNSYILEGREFPVLSMLETIFSKIMHRNVAKQKEADTWPGTICPKIRKKIDKMTEWAKNLGASHAGVYHVTSKESAGNVKRSNEHKDHKEQSGGKKCKDQEEAATLCR
jgi:hypothetical protein